MSDLPKPGLSKAPFIAADGVLVVVACILSFSGEGRPEGWIAFLCVASAVIGGWIAIFPFYAEFKAAIRLREFSQGQDFEQRHQQLESAMMALRDHIEQLSDHDSPTATAMDAKAYDKLSAIESRLRLLEEGHSALRAAVKKVDRATPPDPPSDSVLQQHIADIAKNMQAGEQRMCRLESAVAGLERVATESVATLSKDAGTQHLQGTQDVEIDHLKDELDKLQNELQQRRESAEQIWHDAAAKSASTSVSTVADGPAPASSQAAAAPTEQPADAGRSAPHEAIRGVEGVGIAQPIAKKPQVNEAGSIPQAPDMSGAEEAAADTREAAPVEQEELLVDVPEQQPKAKRSGNKVSTLIAQVLIGIGNKPYVRGEGPGLSQDKGVPMEFLGIGKWQWTAPHAEETITCYIYKNDEIAAEGGGIVLEPGQRRAVSPKFPA